MQDTEKAKIFPASERGYTENGWFQSYNTFNFGKHQNEHKAPFGSLYVLNDDTLAGEKDVSLMVEEDSAIILLPVAGAVEYKDAYGNKNIIEAGQVQFCAAPKGTAITLHNPCERELINFLQLWNRYPSVTVSSPRILSFDLRNHKNTLLPLLPAGRLSKGSSATYPEMVMGMFDGRAEGSYRLSKSGRGVFVFIVQGAFEVQNRLLETKDGLALWDTDTIGFEALSDDAIILVEEVQ